MKAGVGRRGMSLIEVLVASLILALLMLGILEMFSLSLLTDFASGARTEMTYKCQQVVENLRYVQFLRNGGVTGQTNPATGTTGIPDTPSLGTRYTLPYTASDAGWAYWGPSGAYVMEAENGPYQLFYTYADGGAFWTVTVTAQPTQRATSGSTAPGSSQSYLGVGAIVKSVEYVAQLRKNP